MPLTPVEALWTWQAGTYPTVTEYPSGQASKTGLLPSDLDAFVGVPLWSRGNPPVAMLDSDKLERIRRAEDKVEQNTSILLTPTMVASPPALTAASARAANLQPTSADGAMHLGVDYDLADTAYDFKFDRARDNGWLMQQLRYRPLCIVDGGVSAIKQIAYIYPLLNQYFTIPPTWYVEDHDFGLVRIVPSVNVQMLPLFAMQLAVQGFSDSVPGGIAMHYTAGLTPTDYNTRFRFIRELVLSLASVSALGSLQGTVNQGLESTSVLTDGVQTTFSYRKGGAYADLIQQFQSQADDLMETARWQVGGPMMDTL